MDVAHRAAIERVVRQGADAEDPARGGRPEVMAPPPSQSPPRSQRSPASGALRDELESFQKGRVLAALAATHGNQKRAAEMLGSSRRTLINELDHDGIGRPRKSTG